MSLMGSVGILNVVHDASDTNIAASSANPTEIEDSLTSDLASIEIWNNTGENLALYAGANSNLELICYIPGFASSESKLERQPVIISKGRRLSLRNVADSAVTSGEVIINGWV